MKAAKQPINAKGRVRKFATSPADVKLTRRLYD